MRTISKGKLYDGLYILDTLDPAIVVPSTVVCGTVVHHFPSSLWHAKLGHLPYTRLNALKSIMQFDSFKAIQHEFCDICPLAK